MGLFKKNGKKNMESWEEACYAEPDLKEKLSLFSITNGQKTVLPLKPQNKYKVNGKTVLDWKIIFFRKDKNGYVGIGHADYFSTLKKLEKFTLDSDEDSVLIRELTLEELKSLVEVLPKRDSYYSYSAEMPKNVKAEIDETFEKAVRVFKISRPENGEAIATQLLGIVDNILETGEFPEEYEDMVDVAVALGVLFGQALCCGYGWTWKVFGDSEDNTVFGVVSPEENFCNAPLLYLNKILSGQNIGLDGRNDNTVLLLYNMLKDIDERPQDVKYYPVA